jgi:hypothetical protein
MLKGVQGFEIELNDDQKVISGKIQFSPDTPPIKLSLEFATEIYEMALIDQRIQKLQKEREKTNNKPSDLKEIVSHLWPKKN